MTSLPHDFVPGDILSSSWGYSMTIVDFYKVLKVTPYTVIIARIGTKGEKQTGFLAGTVMPDPDHIQTETKWVDGKPVKVPAIYTRRPAHGYVRGHHSSSIASKWDGKPRHFNHCD